MRRNVPWSAWLIFAGVFALVSTVGIPARADGSRVAFLSERLRSDDFRVRTQAALALGAVDDDGAVAPLCGALSDSSEIVRQISAAALKRLARPSAIGCLKGRLANESDSTVKLQLTRAIDSLEAASPSGPAPAGGAFTPRNVPNAKFYVSVNITNNTSRSQADIDRVVLATVRQKLDASGTVQIAPPNEPNDNAKKTIKTRKMTGYHLSIAVDKFDYTGGDLRVRVKCAVSSYPGKDLRGEVPAGVTQRGVSPGDKNAEENLLVMAAGKAVELFLQNFQ